MGEFIIYMDEYLVAAGTKVNIDQRSKIISLDMRWNTDTGEPYVPLLQIVLGSPYSYSLELQAFLNVSPDDI